MIRVVEKVEWKWNFYSNIGAIFDIVGVGSYAIILLFKKLKTIG